MRPFFLILLISFTILMLCACEDITTVVYFHGDFIKEETLSFINDSQFSLDICVYSISDQDIINALEKKAAEGVRIRICTDNAYPFTLPNVHIVYDAQGLMHNKYMLSDSTRVWFGSTNLTPTSLTDHENNILISHDEALVETFQSHFEQCFSGLFKTARTKLGSSVLKFSPEDNCFDFLLNELSHARNSVYIAMFAFSDNRLAHYLKVLSSKGINIRILVDKDWNLSSIYSDIDDMSRYTSLRLDVSPALLHEKFVIIDEKVLLTGSYNYTASAQSRNDEFLFKSTNAQLVNRFTEHFLTLWAESDPAAPIPAGN